MNFHSSDGWVILSPIEQSIKQKIEKVGMPLKDWNISINYGVKTGFNDAFIIDGKTKDDLIRKDPKSAEIIRPILRGRDIKRYGYNFVDLWLIATFPSKKYNIDDYPAIKSHLLLFGKERLEQTGATHFINGQKVVSRKKTTNKWFETQDSISYWDDFSKQKIVWSETNNAHSIKIAFIEEPFFTDKTCFICVGDSNVLKFIYKVMSSAIFTWYITNSSPLLGMQGISLTKETVEKFPVCNETELDLYDAYGFTIEERTFIKRHER